MFINLLIELSLYYSISFHHFILINKIDILIDNIDQYGDTVWGGGRDFDDYEYTVWPKSRDSRYSIANEIIHLEIYYENEDRYKQYSSDHKQKC